jgi:hypothetical protein
MARKKREPVMTAPVRYDFSSEERAELGEKLAASNEKIYQLRASKKLATAEINAAIQGAEDESATLTIKMRQGFEMREQQITILMNRPKRGMAQIILASTGEVLETRPMTTDEMQESFEFEPGSEARPS